MKASRVDKTNIRLIDDIISACVSSSKANKLTLVESNDKKFITRSQIHVTVLQPFGTGKTTDIIALSPKNSLELTSFTEAALLGTISKEGELNESALMNAGGKCLVIDEFHRLTTSARRAMLSLLETQKYNRSLGYKMIKPISIGKKYFKCKGKGGTIEIEWRGSCLCAGLFVARKKPDDQAWMSRYMFANYDVEIDDIFSLLKGENKKKIRYKPYEQGMVFEDYMTFLKRYEEVVKDIKFISRFEKFKQLGFISRNALDICRLAAFYSSANGNSTVTNWEKALDLVPITLYNYISSTLSLREYQVLDLLKKGTTHSEIKQILGIESPNITKISQKLRLSGLLTGDNLDDLEDSLNKQSQIV